ncbi:MAG: nitroreductase family protein [Bacteroidales bacterium]|nr:nitroreductase family protein [Bacteroidales bacterium]
METSFKQAIQQRRSYYAITDQSPVSNKEIEDIINFAVQHVPSAFNSQSTRVVLLLGEHHKKLWNIVLETLRKMVKPESFAGTQNKIDSFAAGYATVLFLEDQTVVESLQNSFPSYSENFPIWSQQTSAMHQLTIWTMLEEVGFGASLQHYNPIIDAEVHQQWNLPEKWKLIAQMPFGKPSATAGEKTFQPLKERIKVFQ